MDDEVRSFSPSSYDVEAVVIAFDNLDIRIGR
jgi:hypothetical protein